MIRDDVMSAIAVTGIILLGIIAVTSIRSTTGFNDNSPRPAVAEPF